ncbi:MAG: hypothetical protein AUH30_09745 [Candidatus Rokubacteria bacterium 13_1_40CM_68_15]|nr:MAG: hypothetical protein AUH30_09745 [Candidatus Rokubacteria bacterium 13_1_40CM_68_15]
MANNEYTLPDFIADLDRITREEASPHVITEKVEPLLTRLIRNPEALPAEYRKLGPGGKRGRYMLHRAPRFNVTSVVWAPGDTAGAHNHDTWGVIGVIENRIEETRYRVAPERPEHARLEITRVMRHEPGAISRLVPGDEVHRMHNRTSRDTVEIHVYGKDLAGLERKTWSEDGAEKRLVSSKYLNC